MLQFFCITFNFFIFLIFVIFDFTSNITWFDCAYIFQHLHNGSAKDVHGELFKMKMKLNLISKAVSNGNLLFQRTLIRWNYFSFNIFFLKYFLPCRFYCSRLVRHFFVYLCPQSTHTLIFTTNVLVCNAHIPTTQSSSMVPATDNARSFTPPSVKVFVGSQRVAGFL